MEKPDHGADPSSVCSVRVAADQTEIKGRLSTHGWSSTEDSGSLPLEGHNR